MRIPDLKTTTRPFVSPIALADYLDISIGTVYYQITKGALPAVRVGRQFRIPIDEARKFAGLSGLSGDSAPSPAPSGLAQPTLPPPVAAGAPTNH